MKVTRSPAMDPPYDVVVVGAGMIGSACARYLSEHRGLRVCVIGPTEPQVSCWWHCIANGTSFNRTTCTCDASAQDSISDSRRDIFGAHYDEARITNCTQPFEPWSQLSARSMQQYRRLEELSGSQTLCCLLSYIQIHVLACTRMVSCRSQVLLGGRKSVRWLQSRKSSILCSGRRTEKRKSGASFEFSRSETEVSVSEHQWGPGSCVSGGGWLLEPQSARMFRVSPEKVFCFELHRLRHL